MKPHSSNAVLEERLHHGAMNELPSGPRSFKASIACWIAARVAGVFASGFSIATRCARYASYPREERGCGRLIVPEHRFELFRSGT